MLCYSNDIFKCCVCVNEWSMIFHRGNRTIEIHHKMNIDDGDYLKLSFVIEKGGYRSRQLGFKTEN